MAVRKTLQIGDPRLKAKNSYITNFNDPELKKVIRNLVDTMHANDLIGLASPQIGKNYQLIITEPRKTKSRNADQTDKLRIYINPKIVLYSKDQNIIYEGCGSVVNGNLFGPVKRPKEITIEAFNQDNHKFSMHCDGILARVIQHEYDHLSGIGFTEKIFDYRKIMDKSFYMKTIKKSKQQVEASKITKKEFLEL